MYNEQLYHHGILGMKWGVRRYQNYDGSYTQRGLQRYRKAESDYESAKENVRNVKNSYKLGAATKEQYKDAKGALKVSKRNLNKSYDKLKTDKMADQGKQLYKRGKTITDNNKMLGISESAVAIGAPIVAKLIKSYNGNTKLANISGAAIAAGGTVVNAALYLKTGSENKKLRAYYAH